MRARQPARCGLFLVCFAPNSVRSVMYLPAPQGFLYHGEAGGLAKGSPGMKNASSNPMYILLQTPLPPFSSRNTTARQAILYAKHSAHVYNRLADWRLWVSLNRPARLSTTRRIGPSPRFRASGRSPPHGLDTPSRACIISPTARRIGSQTARRSRRACRTSFYQRSR